MSTIANAAVAALNKDNQAAVELKAQRLIRVIVAEQDQIKVHESNIADLQKSLQEMARDQFDVTTIFGGAPTGTGLNMETITKVIVDMNKAQQDRVENDGKELVVAIRREQESIKAHEKTIADTRAELNKLSVDEVATSDVLGA